MRIMNKNNTNAVPLNTTTLNTRLLNTTKLNTIGFPVLSKRSGSSADISQAIMDSLVCWYDIGKQQCTNESMASNPVLADLSGNGHDATCYNFAWTEDSGMSTLNYPNALVSDGVDDYAQVTGLPILTKERGYTVVAKRKIWPNTRNAFVSKCTHWLAESEGGVNGAFNIQANGSGTVYSFGKSNNNVPGMNEDVIYQTSKLCNGTIISIGDKEDTDQMAFFSINSGTTWYTKAALYSFLLFDRDLTEQEIEWVKTNLIEGDTEL